MNFLAQPRFCGLLSCLFLLVSNIPSAFPNSQSDSLCVYDAEMLQAARLSMLEYEYEQVIEYTNQILTCHNGLAKRTVIDIYRMRGEAYYGLFCEQKIKLESSGDRKVPSGLLSLAFTQYESIYHILKRAPESIEPQDYKALELLWGGLVSMGYDSGREFEALSDLTLAVQYYSRLAEFLAFVGPANMEQKSQKVMAGAVSGQYYLGQKNAHLAERYLAMSVPVDESYLDMNYSALVSKMHYQPRLSSRMYYNLGGLFYQEVLGYHDVHMNAGLAPPSKPKPSRKSLIEAAELYFRLSYALNPSNIAAKNAVNNILGFK